MYNFLQRVNGSFSTPSGSRKGPNKSVQTFYWNWIISFFFRKFSLVLKTHMKLCVDEPKFIVNFFCSKMEKNWPKMDQKLEFIRFLESIEKFGHYFFKNLSIMKVYIICCIIKQIPYLGKISFLIYGLEWSWQIGLEDF